MLKKFYKIIIIPYILFLLYLMFFGMGRKQMDDNLLTMAPIVSTINFIEGCVSWKDAFRIVAGNIVMFMPFGFLGWVSSRLNQLRSLVMAFISAITIVEALQYFSRMGIFEVDDIILNTFGVFLGFLIKNFIEKRFGHFVK